MDKNDERLKGLTLDSPRVQKETFFSTNDRPGHCILMCAACGFVIEIADRDTKVPTCEKCHEGHTWYKVSEYK